MKFGNYKLTTEKLLAISSVVLLVSLGLCGANFFFWTRFILNADSQPGPIPLSWLRQIFGITSVLELIGILLGIAGLLTVLVRKSLGFDRDRASEEDSNGPGK